MVKTNYFKVEVTVPSGPLLKNQKPCKSMTYEAFLLDGTT